MIRCCGASWNPSTTTSRCCCSWPLGWLSLPVDCRPCWSVEGGVPSKGPSWFPEALSDGVGAAWLQGDVGPEREPAGRLRCAPRESLSKSHVTSFDAALASFATSTRSSQVQRVIQLIQTAVEQNSPLQSVLYDLANDYQRLNDLIDKREKDLSGLVMTIVLFICIGLPGLLAVLIGLLRHRVQATKSTTSPPCSLSSSAPRAPLRGHLGRMLGRMRP